MNAAEMHHVRSPYSLINQSPYLLSSLSRSEPSIQLTPADLEVLDDTESSRLSLLHPQDTVILGIDQYHPHFQEPMFLETANGSMWRDAVIVNVNFQDKDGNYMTDWREESVVLMPDFDTRLSGMTLRQNLYTPIAPDGFGILYVAMKKHGITSCLPAI